MKPLFIPFSSTLQERSVEIVTAQYVEKLRGLYERTLPVITSVEDLNKYEGEIRRAPLIFALACTGGTSRLMIALEKFRRPVVILSHGKQNSLPSALEALHMLRLRKYPVTLVHDLSSRSLRTLKKLSTIGEALHDLYSARILLIGASEDWLRSENYDIERITELFGVNIEWEPLEAFVEKVSKATKDEDFIQYFSRLPKAEINNEAIEDSSRIYVVTTELMREKSAGSIGIRCFPIIMKTKITPCLTISRLIDEGVPATCEADLSANILMILLMRISGAPVFMGNTVDIKESEVVFAHCTVSTKFARNVVLRKHFETEWSVSIAGMLEEGDTITFARFSHDLRKLLAGKGKIVRGIPWSEEFCRTQILVSVDGDASKIIREPVGNHFVIARGDYLEELRILAELFDIRFEKI
ncbi:MAG: hypothetical protein ACTSX9_02910 [Candidatus Njordarchaeales archaeon]